MLHPPHAEAVGADQQRPYSHLAAAGGWKRVDSVRTCLKLDIDAKNPSTSVDAAVYRRVMLESSSIDRVQLPHDMSSEPYLAPAAADDIAMLSKRVHDSLPEWDITDAVQVVNPALASKYAASRHRLAARCNGNPNERMLFHLASDFAIPKIWQAGEGFETRLSQWSEVGKGAYFCEHLIYNYAYKYGLWAPPKDFKVVPEPPVGAAMRVFVVLVSLGKVADMGPGCESCTSAAFRDWKKEYDFQKKDPKDNPLPTRPPVISLPSDAAVRRHMLDLNQVKDEPRCDSVTSTEGDLATHPDSTCKIPAGKHMRDVMHPRLKARAKEWGRQYVLFDSASYPMFIITLTKARGSPMGARQLMDAGCDAARIKALGFTASDVIASDASVQDLRTAGWTLVDFKAAGADASSLIAGGYSVSQLKGAGIAALQLKEAGCSAQQMREAHFGAEELKTAGYNIPVLIAAGYSVSELKRAGFTASQLKAEGLSVQQLFGGNFSDLELKEVGIDVADLYSIISVHTATPDALAQAKAYYDDVEFASQLCAEFAAAEGRNPELSVPLAEAHKILCRIVEHNPLLKSSPPDRQPAWPLHDALIRFDLPLQRYTTQFRVTKKWIPRCFVLRSSRLFYLKAEKGQDDSLEGSLAFMRSNPAPDGKFCIDLEGCSVAACSAPVDGQAFAFEIKFPARDKAPNDVFLAAADDVTRQRCVRAIQAASSGGRVSSLQDIASAVLLTRDLIGMQSLPAVNAVLAALGKDARSLKDMGFDDAVLMGLGFTRDQLELPLPGTKLVQQLKGTGTSPEGMPLTYVYDGFVRESDQMLQGAGVRKWSVGDIQEGNFRGGRMHGQGKFTWANGNVYVGEYAEDKMHGRGKYTYPSGDVYEGEFRNDKINGQGTLTYADGRRESGTWLDGKFVG